jgi:hypothetical protein
MKTLSKFFEAGEQNNLYVAEHRVLKTFRFRKTFEAGDFKGLLFCQLVTEDSGERKVVSYWKNRDSYRAYAEPFKAALGHVEVLGGALHCEIKAKSVPLWRRVSILSVILFITTVLGFWKTMNDQFDEWFEPPELNVFSEQQGPFWIAVNQDAELPLLFRNKSMSTRTTVGDVRYILADGTTNQILFENPQIVALEKGEKITQKVRLKVSKAGIYVLKAEATIKTGKFRMKKTQTNDFPIKVWPEFAFERAKVLKVSSNRCSIAINLISGTSSTNRLRCEARLTNYQGACFENVLPTTDLDKYCDADSMTTEIDWFTQSIGQFQTRTFTLYLYSELPKISAEWTNLIDRIEFKPSFPDQ